MKRIRPLLVVFVSSFTWHAVTLCVGGSFLLMSPSAFPQGSLTPPGAPAPTFKTLQQIQPRTPIDATNTPATATAVFRISAPGSYYVTGNITAGSGKLAIEITSSNVTIDLNGFILQGTSGSDVGIRTIVISPENIVVRNGTVRGFGSSGIDISFGSSNIIENVVASNNGFSGIRGGDNSIIRGCTAMANAVGGISCGHGSTVIGCTSNGNTNAGFNAGTGCTLTNCAAKDNTGNGFQADDGGTLTNCTALNNGGDGISAGTGSTLTNCTAKDNQGTYGIFAGEGSTLNSCTAFSNDVEHGIHADLRSTVTNCTASGNDSAAADSWGISAGAQCTISNCTASGNTNSNGAPTGTTGGGILAGGSSTVQNCTVVGNKGDGIQIAGDSRVFGNNCDSNEFGGGNAAGIHSTGADNRIEGNNVTDNTRGIQVDSGGSLIIRNSSSGSTGPGPAPAPHYVIAAANSFGPVVNVAGVGDIVGTPNANHPWANFSY